MRKWTTWTLIRRSDPISRPSSPVPPNPPTSAHASRSIHRYGVPEPWRTHALAVRHYRSQPGDVQKLRDRDALLCLRSPRDLLHDSLLQWQGVVPHGTALSSNLAPRCRPTRDDLPHEATSSGRGINARYVHPTSLLSGNGATLLRQPLFRVARVRGADEPRWKIRSSIWPSRLSGVGRCTFASGARLL